MQLGDVRVDCHVVVVDLQPHGGKVGLTVYLPAIRSTRKIDTRESHSCFATRLLGEYDVETEIDYIELKARDDAPLHALAGCGKTRLAWCKDDS